MKKIFFFSLLFFFPFFVHAGSVKELKVLNGILSRKFESNNNVYSIVLNSEADKLEIEYVLDEGVTEATLSGVEYQNNKENVAILTVTGLDGQKELYTFYLEKEEEIAVFHEVLEQTNEPKNVIKYLAYYVGFGCFLIILVLFKCIVLGFKRR